MDGIQTYLFLDLETTGLPKEQNNMTKITEISLVAVKRQHLLDTSFGSSPRVQHKLTLCVNPRKIIDPVATEVTGLCNDLLEFEPSFDKNLINLLNTFIDLLTKPVCLIAQNGLNFDFPILRNHLEKFGVSFGEDMACADSFHAFYDIMESQKANRTAAPTLVNTNDLNKKDNDDMEIYSNKTLDIKLKNERSPTRFTSISPVTPKKRKFVRMSIVRRFPWSEGEKPKEKYKLKDIYERLLNRRARNAHHAENDCLLALECAVALSEQFVKWVDENNCLFSQIRPMTIGVRLGMGNIVGLLLVTGMLWGCTNPFIRQGTRGLCKVRAETRFGQAYAEIIFLLGNWRYVVPWLINQGGSLVYLSAVQRVPLSLAVPTANSLAFAFTALTGATLGKEEPLNTGSITGIMLIAVGTALCCWDKVD